MTSVELKAAIDAWVEQYIRQTVTFSAGGTLTASRLNELFNLLITQGDNAAEAIAHIRDFLTAYMVDIDTKIATDINTTLDTWIAAKETEIAAQTDSLIAAANTAKELANTAAANANAAWLDTVTATNAANTAKTNADAAAAAALASKQAADTAAANAITAKQNADTATASATIATNAANSATQQLDTALGQANTARDAANTATTATLLAKTGAETATTDADAATSAADLAKTNADAAAAAALASKQAADTAAANATQAATDIQEAVENLEETYAPRLTTVESQLAEKVNTSALIQQVLNDSSKISSAAVIYSLANQVTTLNDNLVAKASIANNTATTAEGLVLDARQGKALQDQVTTLNANLVTINPVASAYGSVTGGYIKIGKIVIFCIHLMANQSIPIHSNYITGLPRPLDNMVPVVMYDANATDGFYNSQILYDRICSDYAKIISSGHHIYFSGSYITNY